MAWGMSPRSVNDANGSNSEVRARNWAVRFTLKNRRRQPGLSGPKSVKSRCGAVALGRTYPLPPLSSGGALVVPPSLRFHIHRVAGGSRPPPAPTERSVRIYRTTLFGRCFTALQEPATPHMGGAALVSVTASLLGSGGTFSQVKPRPARLRLRNIRRQ